ncbi:type II secretion system F family protein [Brucella intermedia]|uniref:type II secretion system F family protein n=1 Tax=Brucella TaxID=234 RepID=UPI0007C283AD|nr:type II secretion system F family protein [Brucella intermedia]PJT19710.1 type II secretion system protein [Ochrobactrum sp. 30A/1000/2015]PJT40716.1 type II secretion system protein [Ochrobactrum sp. 27A/999/2015]PJT45088.1 type II secretion system protein [Ochrobactrum sp. 23A/997/2015]KAB2710570.1 type II secretion system F family protein [Brucella intermedia]MDL2202459.1 type II secretion system F family protein [Brucella intermedia]
MFSLLTQKLSDPQFLIGALIMVAVFATVVTILLPVLSGSALKSRMKSVATEREAIRSRERARLAAESDRRGSLRHQQKPGIREFVEKLDLKRALADEKTVASLRQAGFRGQNPLNIFLFLRFVLPFGAMAIAAIYIFVLGVLADQTFFVRLLVCIFAGYAGFYAPNLYVSNRATKRKQSIRRAWPDALDLMLICVESGMSTEAAFRRVADEIGIQSVELAEELMLTNAELSFLPERRQAYENLANRTGLEPVKSVTQALIQAERYGTPVAQALRTLSHESRDLRLLEAEKKAAALPPKLTVPMIVFFLPVLFIVILGPAFIQISAQGGLFGGN